MSSSRTYDDERNNDNMSDTLSLIFASVADVIFSQRAPETKLKVPPGVPAEHESGTNCTKDKPACGDTRASPATEGQHGRGQ
ncbi:hypothetical protein BST61_g2842 [Cercospora zeina]